MESATNPLSSSANVQADMPQVGWRVRVIRLIWWAVALVTVTLFVIGLPSHYAVLIDYVSGDLLLEQLDGIIPDFIVLYNITLDVLTVAVYWLVAFPLFLTRSNDVMALLASLMLLTLGTAVTNSTLSDLVLLNPQFGLVAALIEGVAQISLITVAFTVPDGRFVPRWSRWFAIAYGVWILAYTCFPQIDVIRPGNWQRPLFALIQGPIFLAAFASQIYRYRVHLTQTQRQQVKWTIYGFGAAMFGYSMTLVGSLVYYGNQYGGWTATTIQLVIQFILLLSLSAVPVGIGFSVWRYRLWDVDLALHRSVIYAGVTLVLGMLFVLAFFVGQVIFRIAFGGDQTATSAALGAAVIVLVFNPIRTGLQRFIDRRLYGFRFGLDQLEHAEVSDSKHGFFSGNVLDGYHLLGVIGRGGMGDVYAGLAGDRPVAVKVLSSRAHPGSDARRFEREAAALKHLRHPHIVQMIDVGHVQDVPYLVMEYVQGRTLAEVLKEQGRLEAEPALRILRAIASALDYVHEQGIIHRDVTPGNIMLRATSGDGPEHPVLMDFGLVKIRALQTDLTGTNAIGTMQYMSTEQIQSAKTVDHRTDIYALGIIAYEMLTGVPPFAGSLSQILFAHLYQPAPDARTLCPEISAAAALAIMRAMAKNAEDRYESAGAFVRAMEET